MSEESKRPAHSPEITEAAGEIGDPAVTGTLLLARSALRSPSPREEAEGEARVRALSAYQEILVEPRALHADPWGGHPLSVASRLAEKMRQWWNR
jgi:hypothetical protein